MAHHTFSTVKAYALGDEGQEYCALVRMRPGQCALVAWDILHGQWRDVRPATEADMKFFAAHQEPANDNEVRLTHALWN